MATVGVKWLSMSCDITT